MAREHFLLTAQLTRSTAAGGSLSLGGLPMCVRQGRSSAGRPDYRLDDLEQGLRPVLHENIIGVEVVR